MCVCAKKIEVHVHVRPIQLWLAPAATHGGIHISHLHVYHNHLEQSEDIRHTHARGSNIQVVISTHLIFPYMWLSWFLKEPLFLHIHQFGEDFLSPSRCWKTRYTLHQTSIAPARLRHPKRKQSSSNHPFSAAMIVSGRVIPTCVVLFVSPCCTTDSFIWKYGVYIVSMYECHCHCANIGNNI